MSKTNKLRAPQIRAEGLESQKAVEFINECNSSLQASFDELVSSDTDDAQEVLLGLARLEAHAEACRAEALQMEADHLRRRLTEIVNSRGKRVLHVRRRSDGLISHIVEL
jgi:hypothetical protein